MLITVKRLISNSNETLSAIYIDGALLCYGLEDEYRAQKIAGETRISADKYKIKLRSEGGIHPRYLQAFPDIHKGMLWLQDVPNFTYIYFHMGNTDEHTAGCILVAQDTHIDHSGTITLRNSRAAYQALYERVLDAAWHGSLEVEIKDEENATTETR